MDQLRFSLALCLIAAALQTAAPAPLAAQNITPNPAIDHAKEPGLLFYLSGDHGFNADYAAGGDPVPNFLSDVKILPGGAKGSYIQCGNNQLLSYWAPGNIYSQRGTVSFYWRSRDPVDKTEFPVFRVGYADHSSWDMVFLRIDYNGHGFDAFVTDANLTRTRVSFTMPDFPRPDQWVHLALTWDETIGIRLYVNGKLAGTKAATGMFDAGLDQFGPHSRIIGPTGVESSLQLRPRRRHQTSSASYDRALSDDNIASLAKGELPQSISSITRSFASAAIPSGISAADTQKEWWYNNGWNRPNDIPAPLPAQFTTVRKVEIHDVYDLKRWWWRGTDGIRETTWPGVYNRSRLPGRFDYFQLPDWDCYSLSGKSVTFYMPDEPWNHLEIDGAAYGKLDLLTPGAGQPGAIADPDQHDPSPMLAKTLFERPQAQQRTSNQLAEAITGEKIRFTNVEQEQPIGELSAYYVHPGKEPAGAMQLSYRLTANGSPDDNPSLKQLVTFINGRFPADERMTMVATAGGGSGRGGRGGAFGPAAAIAADDGAESPVALATPGAEPTPQADGSAPAGTARRGGRPAGPNARTPQTGLPLVHILIPVSFRAQPPAGARGGASWQNIDGGLDGIAIDAFPLPQPQAHARRIHPDEHPDQGPHLADARHARLQLLRQTRRAPHSLAPQTPATGHPAQR